MLIKNWYKHNSLKIAIIYAILLFFLSLANLDKQPINLNKIKHIDKLYHMFAYGFLSIVWLFAYGKSIKKTDNNSYSIYYFWRNYRIFTRKNNKL